MGRYFDVSGYPGEKSALDLNTGLSSLGDALTDVLARRQKAQQFQQDLDFQREDAGRKFAQNQGSLDYQNRIIDQREKRDQLKFRQDQGEMQRKATADAAKAMAEGNPEMAKAILHGAVSYDPATGQETGRGELVPGQMRDVGPAPQEPQAPTPAQPVPPEIAARRRGRTSTSEDEAQSFYQSQGRPMPSAVGVDPTEPPVFTDDGRPPSVTVHDFSPEVQSSREQATSDMAAEEQARLDAAGHDKAQTAFEAASQAYPHLRAEYDAKLAAAKGEQPYTIRFGANDPGVEVNPAALRYGARHAAAEDFAASIRGLNLDERGKANAAAALAALEYGRSKEQVYAQFDRAQATGQKFEDATALQSQRDAAALERAKIAGPRNPGDFHVGQLHEQQEAGTIRDQNFFLNSFKDWEQKAAQIPLQGKSYPRLTQALKNINSGNPALQRDAQSQLVSYFSGGGVVREFEQKFLLSHLAGLGAQGETAIEHLKTGRLGPQDLAVMQQATHMALQEQRQRAEELYDAAKGGYGPGTGFDYFGGNVDAKVRATLRAIGFDPPPMYPGVEPVQIGDIARPYRSQLGRTGSAPPAARPRRGAPPEVDARIRGKSASDLDSAMQ